VNVALKSARREDLPVLMRYVHAFQRLDQRPFNLHRTERALLPLLISADQGRVWIIEAAGHPIGYLALCYGYSLHSGGREALVDGFFVEEEFRNRGIGTVVLRQVLGEARAAGVVAVHVRPGAAAERARRLLTAAGLRCGDPAPMLSANLGSGS
jgi:GNAT superfamily N-acetyltransferase